MNRFSLIVFFLLLAFRAVAQNKSTDSTQILLSRLQEIPADTNKVKSIIHAGLYVINKPGAGKGQLDSGIMLLHSGADLSKKLKNLVWENNCLQAISAQVFYKGDTTQSFQILRQIIASYHQAGDFGNEADSWNTYGNFSGAAKATQLYCYQRALKIFNDHHKTVLSAHTSVHIGLTYLDMDKPKLAYPILEKASKILKSAGKFRESYDCETKLADYYWKKGNVQQSLFYNIEAVKSAEKMNDESALTLTYWKLGNEYFNLKLFDKSLVYIEKSFLLTKKNKDVNSYHTSVLNVVHARIRVNQTKDLIGFIDRAVKYYPMTNDLQRVSINEAYAVSYSAIGNNKVAENYFLRTMALFNDLIKKHAYGNNVDVFVRSYNRATGAFYIKIHQYEKARPYYEKILLLPKNIITPNTEMEVHAALFQIDSAAGRYIHAIKHYEVKTQLHDSLFNATSARQVAELNAKYETDERVKDIKLLKSQRDAVELSAQKATLQRNITFGAIALSLMLAIVFFIGFRNKQRTNLQLQSQQAKINQQNQSLQSLLGDKEMLLSEKDWLLKEVHHRVKNNLQIIMSLLNSQSVHTENSEALEAINKSKNRVQAISLIHKKLFNDDSLETVNIKSYVSEMVIYLSHGFGTNKRNITFRQLIEPIKFDIGQAVSVGLILNEAITNSIKYAFDDRGGEIEIALNGVEEDDILLQVRDNGRGLPSQFEGLANKSLGFDIMKGLTSQLKGTMQVENTGTGGLTIAIRFKLMKPLTVQKAEVS